jgi:cytochrome c
MISGKGLVLAALASVALAGSAIAAPMPLDIKDASGKAMMGDPVHGEVIFHRCMVCHTIQAGVNHIGPSLHGVVGRHSGIEPNYSYSAANKKSGITWTEQNLFQYLKAPQQMVPGTKMTFPGLPAEQDRADVISYLKKNS